MTAKLITTIVANAQWAAGGDFREKRKNKNAEKGKKEKLKKERLEILTS